MSKINMLKMDVWTLWSQLSSDAVSRPDPSTPRTRSKRPNHSPSELPTTSTLCELKIQYTQANLQSFAITLRTAKLTFHLY